MSEKRIEKAWESMKNNLQEKTGKALSEWIEIINKQPLTRTSDKVNYLKKEYGLGHGYAGMIIYQAKLEAEGSAPSLAQLVEKQYASKPDMKPIYDELVKIVKGFGTDVEINPKQSYVSLCANTQFAMLTPATKTRFDVGIKLKDQEPKGVLELLPKPGMCTHTIKLSRIEDINPEVISWLKLAYNKASKR